MSNKQIYTLSTHLRRIRKEAIDLFIDLALNAKERSIKGDGLCLQRSIIESFDPQLYSDPKSANDVKRSLDDALQFRRNSLEYSSKMAVTIRDNRQPKIISLDQFCQPKPDSETSYYFSEQEHLAAAVNLINIPMPEVRVRIVRPLVILVDREDEQLNFQVIFPEGTIDSGGFSGDILQSGAIIRSHDSIHYDAIVPKRGNTFKFEKRFAECFGESLNRIAPEDFVTMDTIVLTDAEHDAKTASGGESVWSAHVVGVNLIDIVNLWQPKNAEPQNDQNAQIVKLHRLLSQDSEIQTRLAQVLAQASREAPVSMSATAGFGAYVNGSADLNNDIKRAIRKSIKNAKSRNRGTRKNSKESALSKLGWFGKLSKKIYSRKVHSRKVHPNSGPHSPRRPPSPQTPRTPRSRGLSRPRRPPSHQTPRRPPSPQTPRTPRSRGLSRPRNNTSKNENYALHVLSMPTPRSISREPSDTTSNAAIAKALSELD